MFEYLCRKVKPTEDSVRAMVETELPELVARITGESPETDLKRLCSELDQNSLWLGKAARAGGQAVVRSLQPDFPDVPSELWLLVQVWTTVATLAVLRLVERELEAEELARQLKLG